MLPTEVALTIFEAPRSRLVAAESWHLWRSVAVNGGWILADKVLRQGLAVLIGAWVARHLGPDQYGSLAYALALLAFFQVAAALGADSLLVRDMASRPEEAGEVLGVALRLRLVAGAVAWALAVVTVAALQGWHHPAVVLIALAGGVMVFQPGDLVDLWFQSQSQARRTVAARIGAYLLSAGGKVALILTNAPLWTFALMVSVEAALAAVGMFVAYRRYPAPRPWNGSAARARALLHENWPFLVSGLSVITYLRIDQLMLEQMLGSGQLGVYAAMLPLSQAAQFVPMALMSALAPLVARAKHQDQRAYDDVLVQMFRLFGILGLMASIGIAVLAPWVVPLMFGPAYIPGVPVLMVHGASNFFIFQGVAQGLWLANERAGVIGMYKAILGAVVSIGANLLLVPRYGLMGAALSAVAAQATSAVLANFLLAPRVAMMQFGFRPAPPKARR